MVGLCWFDVVGGCGSGGVAVEWQVACGEMVVWPLVWLFVGAKLLWVWVFGYVYECSVIVEWCL